MKTETDPVTPDEWLIRLVWHQYFTPREIPISRQAFVPKDGRNPETKGISLYREACLRDVLETLLPLAPEKQPFHGLVRLPVSLFTQLGLTIHPDPTDVPGHVLIPEINITVYKVKSGEKMLLPKLLELAKVASENIVRRPPASESSPT